MAMGKMLVLALKLIHFRTSRLLSVLPASSTEGSHAVSYLSLPCVCCIRATHTHTHAHTHTTTNTHHTHSTTLAISTMNRVQAVKVMYYGKFRLKQQCGNVHHCLKCNLLCMRILA